ncbi:hypothetical protein CDQ84_09560 [Clostridium thermosuccinogenes]|jgi:RNA polymerase sigma-70 factor (ECF subfamily)|uniref:RNA polymerase sigma-70 region 2 domain-containing protein n=1 Tax=Clostridium thermosuccinogenes TaxID=84032 RepID=A0A2K2FEJ1_9CLOT|nr:sigma factor [Pseudoclostridium thermosuccinogenes]AUS98251.1 hypothetical protein CDO33_18385 [Pseudoclostridium thermosuccinogenes]PNT91100.1 hypothetical protein CDQ83_14895 [Pseudoclostridium thermosuccinogenes]PNT97199.1 hypothetical protein CDQ85_09410 [Pseudoclostridium thermosuccinogenes]PNT99091.1 hypothetical protein CDQ84_09560 [Pseudoclostridium thermosuccinogenes]
MEYNVRSLFLMAKGGDIEAYERLIETYQKKIYTLALKVSGDRSDASEMAQEVFIRAYKSIHSLKDEKQLPILIYRAAAGVCLNSEKQYKEKISYSRKSTPG